MGGLVARQTEYLKGATFEDIKIMIRYLKDNNYISISDYNFDDRYGNSKKNLINYQKDNN